MKTQMRCCKKCGCYLPDNTTLCLACGYDETPKQEPSGCQDTGRWNALGEELSKNIRREVTQELLRKQAGRLSTVKYTFTSASDYQDPAADYQIFAGDLYERPDYARDGVAFYDLSTGHCYRFNAKTNTWVEIS